MESKAGRSKLLRTKLGRVPTTPGVYLFRDNSSDIIYIGKAKNLKNRVRSYFQDGSPRDLKSEYLKRHVEDVDCVVTDNEVEALILESSLVKKHQPRLNVRLKDDKSFLHIKLTVNEEFPRVLLTRRIRNDGALYFGPYLPASLARSTIKIINRHFLLRTCSIEIDGALERPCLEYFIKRCLGPCVKGLCTSRSYRKAVHEVRLLLEGRNQELLKELNKKMSDAAEKELYETAAFFRDRIQLVKGLAEKQKMASTDSFDIDVFAYYREDRRIALQLLTMRNGRVAGKREFYWEDLEVFDPASFLRDALQQFYLHAGFIPDQIYLPAEIEDQQVIQEWLSEKKRETSRRKVKISTPKRGEKLDLVLLVERNARIAFDSRFRILRTDKSKILQSLEQQLELPRLPKRIEAFDISNIQGSEPVASMVVCVEGVMQKREYRKFKIKTVQAPDDFAAMREVVSRRYSRLLSDDSTLPDLVLVDGGKGQLSAAFEAMLELGIEDTPLASIAKKEELVFVKGVREPVSLMDSSRALHLIQEIRDEAHRFAVSYHRKRRHIRDFSSELDRIPGIGSKRKKRLLQNFGSLSRIRRATVTELTPFLGRKLAEQVKKQLNER